jgi:hypothetical protein
MTEVSQAYLNGAITSLLATIGVRDPVDGSVLASLISAGQPEKAIEAIAKTLGLPIRAQVTVVSDTYSADAAPGFTTKGLVQRDGRGGSSGIVAQVSIPQYLPFYGAAGMNGLPINIRISENCTRYPLTFACVMAHELTHIVLHSMRHKDKDNEFCTDLAAMMLGFSDVMASGRKVVTASGNVTRTTTYGYLSDSNFDYARVRIDRALEVAKTRKALMRSSIVKAEKRLGALESAISCFRRYLVHLGQKPPRTMSQDDGRLISSFHQPDYADAFERHTSKLDAKLVQMHTATKRLTCYDDHYSKTMASFEQSLESINADIATREMRIRGDIAVLRRHASMGCKFRALFWK